MLHPEQNTDNKRQETNRNTHSKVLTRLSQDAGRQNQEIHDTQSDGPSEKMNRWNTGRRRERTEKHDTRINYRTKQETSKQETSKPAHSFTANKGNKRENNELLQKCFVDLTSLKCFFKREESFSELSLRNLRLVPCKPERSLTSAAGSSTFGSIVT